MVLTPKIFLRLLNQFEAIFRRETSTALQRRSPKQILGQVLLCLTLIGETTIFAFGRRNFFRFRFKSAE